MLTRYMTKSFNFIALSIALLSLTPSLPVFAQAGKAATATATGTVTSTSVQSNAAPNQTGQSSQAPKGPKGQMTREEHIAQHEKMQTMHTKMIECLKANKPVPECQQQMHQTCTKVHNGTCPFGGHGHKGKGMGKGGNK